MKSRMLADGRSTPVYMGNNNIPMLSVLMAEGYLLADIDTQLFVVRQIGEYRNLWGNVILAFQPRMVKKLICSKILMPWPSTHLLECHFVLFRIGPTI